MKRTHVIYVILGIILVAGLYMRLEGIRGVSLTNDELSGLNRTQYDGFTEMIKKGVAEIDYHPAGVQSFLYAWTKMFGMGTHTVRQPFVLFGLLSICLTFLIGRIWSTDRAGLIAAALMAGLAFPILYSRLARPYSPALFFVLASAYFWSKAILSSKASWKHLFWFVMCGVLAAWSHYYAAVMVAILGLIGLFYVKGKRLRNYLISGVTLLGIAGLHWPITKAQLSNEGIGGPTGWLDAPAEGWIMDFLMYAFNGPLFFWIMVTITAIGIWFVIEKKASWRPFVLMIFIALLHFGFGYYYSHEVQPILQYSGLLFSFPFLLIALAHLIEKIPVPTVIVLPLLILGGSLFTSARFADYKGNEQFGKFKELARSFDGWARAYQNDITFASNVNDGFYLDHYLRSDLKMQMTKVKDREELFAFREMLENSKTTQFAFCWSTIQMPLEVYPLIKRYFPYVIENDTYFNSQVTLFSKKEPLGHTPDETHSFGQEIQLPIRDSSDIRLLEEEFSPQIIATAQELRELSRADLPYIEFNVNLRAAPGNNPVLVMEWYRKSKRYAWHGSELNEFYPSGEWRTLLQVNQMPKDVWMDDELKLYIWNRGPGRIEIRDIRTSVRKEP